jgi:peptidoglycan hydrolase CwlO-like protein
MHRRTHKRLVRATAAAALAAAAVALCCAALVPGRAAASPTAIIAVQTPTTLKGLEAAARGQRRQMARLEAQMQVIGAQYDAAVADLTAVNMKLSQTRLQLAQSQSALSRQNALVGARLAAMYKMGTFSFLDVLAGSATLTQAQTEVTFFKRLTQQGQRDTASLARLNAQVTGLADALATQRSDSQTAQSRVDAQRLAMSDKIAQRRAILEAFTRQIQRILAAQNPHSGGLVSSVPLSGSYTPITWAKALLEQLGMPLTQQNAAAITAWEMAEGGHWHNTAHYNPLDTTMPEPGATAMNSVGVKAYLSWAQGFTATIATLRNGYYGGILAALRSGTSAIVVADAVAASPWGTGNFSGLL